MGNDVFVWIEQFHGQVSPPSWEAIGTARRLSETLGGQVCACLFGDGVEDLAQEAIAYGADRVFLADDPTFSDFRLEPHTALMAHLAEEHEPEVILIGATSRGRDMGPGVAVELESGCVADCTTLDFEDGQLVATRPIYAGKLLCTCIVPERRPAVFTLRPRSFPKPDPDSSRQGEVIEVELVLSEEEIHSKVIDFQGTEGGVSLTDAAIIVSGGRGVAGSDGFEPVRKLAEVLGGAVGSSRAAVDAGWIPYEHQVGQTGKTVSPDLYVACGISGAIQHQAGMRTSKVIVAINKDPEAPIFQLAHYGIVDDLFKIVPALTEALKERLG